jgi:hypothetical protein
MMKSSRHTLHRQWKNRCWEIWLKHQMWDSILAHFFACFFIVDFLMLLSHTEFLLVYNSCSITMIVMCFSCSAVMTAMCSALSVCFHVVHTNCLLKNQGKHWHCPKSHIQVMCPSVECSIQFLLWLIQECIFMTLWNVCKIPTRYWMAVCMHVICEIMKIWVIFCLFVWGKIKQLLFDNTHTPIWFHTKILIEMSQLQFPNYGKH